MSPKTVAEASTECPLHLFAQRRTLASAEQDHVLLSAIVNASDDAILSKTLGGIITTWNSAAERMFGYTAQEIIGQPKTVLFPPERLEEEEIILERLRQGLPTDHFETVRLRKDGTPIRVSVSISPIKNADGHVIGASTIARDITEMHRLRSHLKERLEQFEAQNILVEAQNILLEAQNVALEALATTDGLTGVKNHRAFQERLREEHARAARSGTPLSVLMLDVDKFKQYNDTYGHPGGDTVLRQLARILRETARNCDIVARYGGEEFAILLPGANVEQAKQVAERFRHSVETARWPERPVTVSIGVSTLCMEMANPDSLLAEADAALYRSKHRGRNCVTHAADLLEIKTTETKNAPWYDSLLHQLLEAQAEILGSAAEQERVPLCKAYEATIESWSHLLYFKDVETEDHSERVTEMTMRLMRHLGFNEQEVLFARWGARLHDIGKMAIPDHILHKPGPLTGSEWDIMRQHPALAKEMLQPIEFLGPAIDIPYCHHERWDGSGYPCGLKEDEIPLMARLFTVVDVYDALTNERPYRKAWTPNRARTYLEEKAGTQFDPRAVHALISLLDEPGIMKQAA